MGYIFSLLAATGFGVNDLCIHLGMRSGKCTTSQAVIINLIAGNIVLIIIGMVTYFTVGFPPLNMTGMLFFIAAGICSPFFGRIFSFSSIKRIGATRTTTLRVSDSLFTIVIAYFILGDTISLQSLVGAVILIAGVMLLINETGKESPVPFDKSAVVAEQAAGVEMAMQPVTLRSYISGIVSSINIGSLYALVAAVFFALGGVFRQMSMTYVPSALLGTLVGTFVALITNSAYIYFSGQPENGWSFTRGEITFFALGGLANSIAILFFFSALVSGTSISITAALKNTSPLFTLFLSWVFLRKAERFTLKLVFSIVVVILGAFIIVLA